MGRFRGLLAAYGATLTSLVYGLGSAAVLTRLLTVEDYGVWSQYRVVSGLVMTSISLNLGHGFLRFGAGADPDRRRAMLARIIGLQTALVLLATLLALPLADVLGAAVFDRTGAGWWLAVGAWAALMLAQTQLVNSLLMQQRAAVAYNLMSVYRLVALGSLGLLVFWPAVEGAVVVSLAGLAGVTALLAWLARGELSWPRVRDLGLLAEPLRFCLPLLPVQLAMWVVASSDRFFLKAYDGLEAVARYSLVYTFALLVPTIYSAVSSIFLAAVVRWYEAGDEQRVARAFSLAIRAYWVVGSAMLLGLYLGAVPITTWLAGETYAFAGVREVALLVGLGGFLHGLFQICSRLFDLARRSWSVSATWVVAMVLNLLLNAALIPSWGLDGAAIATAVSYAIALSVALAIRPRDIPLDVRAPRLVLYTLGLVALGAATDLSGLTPGLAATFAWATLAGGLALALALGGRVVTLAELRQR